jgi:hypothetical protein
VFTENVQFVAVTEELEAEAEIAPPDEAAVLPERIQFAITRFLETGR